MYMADPLQDTPEKPKIIKYVLACSLLASLLCILAAYDLAVLDPAATKAREDFKISDDLAVLDPPATKALEDFKIPDGAETYAFFLSQLVATIAAARTADWIGRRKTLVLSGTAFFAGSLSMVLVTNYRFFVIGGILTGIGFGYTLIVAPLYTAEISPVSSRGFLTSLPELFFNIGSLLGGISSYGFSKLSTHLGWRLMVGITTVPSMLVCIGLLTIIESPRWLVMKGRLEDARRILDKTSASMEESQLRLEEVRKAAGIPPGDDQTSDVVPVPSGTTFCSGFKQLFVHPTPSVRHMFVTVLGIHFFQQATGVNTLNLYSSQIFQKAGVEREIHLQFISIVVGLTGIVCNLVVTMLVDKVGRRILLLYSVGGMAFSLMALALGLTIIQRYPDQKLMWALVMCIICSLSSITFSSIGIGPIPWIYSSEIFPSELRALGNGMAAALNIFTGGVVALTFPILISIKPDCIAMLIFFFAGMAILAWIFIYLFLPETKGTSLEEMETLFVGLGLFCSERIRKLIFDWRQNVRVSRMFWDGFCSFYIVRQLRAMLP